MFPVRQRHDDEYSRSEQSEQTQHAPAAPAKRACDSCHRMKMRCIMSGPPPCDRCRNAGHACKFQGPRRPRPANRTEDRLESLEKQLHDLSSSMYEIRDLHRASYGNGKGNSVDNIPRSQSISNSIHDYYPQQAIDSQQTISASSASDYLQQRRHTHPYPDTDRPEDDSTPDVGEGKVTTDISHGPWANIWSLAQAAKLQERHVGIGTGVDQEWAGDMKDGASKSRARGVDHGRQRELPEDPVSLGWCTYERGKELFDFFMRHCLFYIPVLDPSLDTWDSLLDRSSLIITVILMIAQRSKDAGGQSSDLYKQCAKHTEDLVSKVYTAPHAKLENIQALILIAGWSDTRWRPNGHAMSMAIELGLFRCLAYLAQNVVNAPKTLQELEKERPSVIGARIWLTLFETECQLALSLGRPSLLMNVDSINGARRLLKHPLSIETDSRLVHFCELQAIRLPLYNPYTGSAVIGLEAKVLNADDALDEWYTYWDAYYVSHGHPATSLMRESLLSMRSATTIYSNSLVLQGIRHSDDVDGLSRLKRYLLDKTISAGSAFLQIVCESKEWTANLRCGNSNTHFNIVYIARYMIRVARIMPSAIALPLLSERLDMVVDILTRVPGHPFPFSLLLEDEILKARMAGVIPWHRPPELFAQEHSQYTASLFAQSQGNLNLVTGINPGQYPFDLGQGFGGANHNFLDQVLFESTDLVGDLFGGDDAFKGTFEGLLDPSLR